jgi:hypothetical protein
VAGGRGLVHGGGGAGWWATRGPARGTGGGVCHPGVMWATLGPVPRVLLVVLLPGSGSRISHTSWGGADCCAPRGWGLGFMDCCLRTTRLARGGLAARVRVGVWLHCVRRPKLG